MATALITGTSKGIGFEAALAFARAGHTVIAAMRTPSNAPALAEIAAKENLPISVITLDVDSDQSVRDAFARIAKDHGPVDILVNNAGIERSGTVEELPLDEFRAVMETNYFGVIRCTQALLPQMRARRSGVIINISSVAGRLTSSPLSSYMASKWALEALSEALAGEMKTFNVRVAIVEPGIIDTAMARRIGDLPIESAYPQPARFALLFEASLKTPVPPTLVAQKILDVAQTDSWQLRYPVGPDAEPFLGWRKSLTDEEWVELNATDDNTWYVRIQSDFGLDTRPKP